MRKYFLTVAVPAFFAAGLFLHLGCESERDTTVPSPSDMGGRPDSTNLNTTAGEQLMIYGTTTVADGANTTVGSPVTAPDDGTLLASVTWTTPESLDAYYTEVSIAGNKGTVTGTSPLAPSVAVTSGQAWSLHISNTSGTNVSLTYQVTFVP